MSQESKNIVRRYFEAVEKQDEAALDGVLHPDVVVRFPGAAEPVRGRDGFKKVLKTYRQAASEFDFELGELVAEGDKVVVRWKVRFKHGGSFGERRPTGREGSISGLDLIRVSNGKIVEITDEQDMAAVERQVGFSPALPPQAK